MVSTIDSGYSRRKIPLLRKRKHITEPPSHMLGNSTDQAKFIECSPVIEPSAELEGKGAFVFGEDIATKIKGIADNADLSQGEVIRRALVLMEIAVDALNHQDKLVILDQDDNVKTKITGLVNEGR